PIQISRDPCRLLWLASFASIFSSTNRAKKARPCPFTPSRPFPIKGEGRRGPHQGMAHPSILPAVPLIEEISGRHLTGDVDRHRITFPVLDQRRLAKISVHELLNEFIAAELEKLHVRLDAPIDRHGNAPRAGEYVRILDRHLVPDDVGRPQREALDQVQRVAMKIPGTIEPGPIVEIRHIDEKYISVPSSDRMAHPGVVGRADGL